MNATDNEYKRLLNLILSEGRVKHNRTGIDTKGVFGAQARFDLSWGFPILTTKKVFFKGIVHELLWFLRGDTNIKYLVDNGVHIWDEWAYKIYKEKPMSELWEGEYYCPNIFGEGISKFTQEQFIQKIKEDAKFASKWGELGEGTYGGMWRKFSYYIPSVGYNADEACAETGTVDQIQKVMDKLKNNPDDRRMIVSAWHPYWIDHCALPPCHCLFHFNTEELTHDERCYSWVAGEHGFASVKSDDFDKWGAPKRRLNVLLYQRSCDTFLGVPFNITSYSLLLAMVAHCVNMVPGTFVHTYGDLHIYQNHMDQVKLLLSREPMEAPKLWLNPKVKDLFAFKYEDIKLVNYVSHPSIAAEVAV